MAERSPHSVLVAVEVEAYDWEHAIDVVRTELEAAARAGDVPGMFEDVITLNITGRESAVELCGTRYYRQLPHDPRDADALRQLRGAFLMTQASTSPAALNLLGQLRLAVANYYERITGRKIEGPELETDVVRESWPCRYCPLSFPSVPARDWHVEMNHERCNSYGCHNEGSPDEDGVYLCAEHRPMSDRNGRYVKLLYRVPPEAGPVHAVHVAEQLNATLARLGVDPACVDWDCEYNGVPVQEHCISCWSYSQRDERHDERLRF